MNSSFILIFVCLIVGALLKRTGRFPASSGQAFNSFVIWVSLPAVVLTQVPVLLEKAELDASLLIPISMPWIQFFLSFILFYYLAKKFRWSPAETGALILTAGLGNTSFVGFPILESFYGKEGLSVGILVDQPGSFFVVSTIGLVTATLFSSAAGTKLQVSTLVKKIISFPPFIALILGILRFMTGTYGPSAVQTVLDRLAITLVPLALIAVGFQLNVSAPVLRRQWRPLLSGLAFKLFVSPAVFFFFYIFLLGEKGLMVRATVIEAAMAPMITAAVIAEDFKLNSEIANLMVGVGIPLSLATVYLWHFFLSLV
ncbi:MAG: AEC family transporter [Bdellovibrio sp.]